MQKNLIIIGIIAITLFMTACEPHRIDIQQGNKVTPENYARLKTGMSRNQVVFVLGSPLLKDPFHQNRWDYIYYLKPGNNKIRQSRLTLYFEGDKLIRIDDSAYTPEAHGDKAKIEDLDSNDLPPTLALPLG
ncbi:MAG: outer membrane protein assembly factor BamE [Gammaproteobacteria bacterium]|nr:outer membrane protein assembly factor BamE [Gammaproteobacteria bacterium]